MIEPDFQLMREAMIAGQLRTNNVSDPRVIAAIRAVPREAFVPAARRALAYTDLGIALDDGTVLNSPLATARLLTEAAIAPGDAVLLVAAAPAYAAALLEALGARVTVAATAAGDESGAPYDAIIVDGAIETVPDAFREQLREGGRLLTGLIENSVTRLARATRSGNSLVPVAFADINVVPLPSFEKPKVFAF